LSASVEFPRCQPFKGTCVDESRSSLLTLQSGKLSGDDSSQFSRIIFMLTTTISFAPLEKDI
jgi:hypothetical protein